VTSFVKEGVCCKAKSGIEFVGGKASFRRGGNGGVWDVADERGPILLFRVVDDPTSTGGGMGVGAREVEGVKEACVVRSKGESERDLA
jgi:hypothetical protein